MENGNGGGSSDSNDARLVLMELANMMSVPMSLNAVVKLKVADAIWESGANAPLSAAQILAKIRPDGSGDAENLQRLLRMLTSYGVFAEHIVDDSGFQRRYSLTDVGKLLTTDENGVSCGYYVLQHHQDALMKAWPFVDEAVIDSSTEPFVKVNGEPPYDYYGKKPELNSLMQKAMSGIAVPFMKGILENYNGFEGVKTLVDVGGNAGAALKMILDKHPSIQLGINFDLPEVVEKAPAIPRMKHHGGDVIKSIPNGDAIFIKWVLLNWTDDECKIILKNCYNALPVGGKVIACDPILPRHTDNSNRTRTLLEGDILIMTMYRVKGKHRTEEEFWELAKSVGFTRWQAFYADHYFPIIEFHK